VALFLGSPWQRLAGRLLAATLPCGVRTFLDALQHRDCLIRLAQAL